MSASMVWTGAIVLCFAVVIFTMLQENARRRKRLLEKIEKSYGQIPDREYTWEHLGQISEYYRNQKKEQFVIDDITWNDLDMDRIFMLMNNTISSPGEDYLYYLLRTPEFSREELASRECLIDFFGGNGTVRKKTQEILGAVRKPPSSSVYGAIHSNKDFYVGDPIKQIFMFAAFLLSAVAFVLVPSVGVFLFLVMSCINIGTYLRDKEKINGFLTGFRCMIQLLNCAEKIEKLQVPELAEYAGRLKECRKSMGNFKKGAVLVLNRGAMESGPETIFLDYLRMMTHIDLIKFNSMMKSMKDHEKEAEEILAILGLLDACISIASFREAMPYFCIPDFTEYKKSDRTGMRVENLYHPLIQEPVANSLCTDRGILLTGSNASGKSTFLKNIALNAIMAQTVHTCTASFYQAPFYRTMTSMALRDDLESSESYYIVEIKSLKRILEEGEKETPLLCIIDEVLRGTNTIERIAASSRILQSLCKPHILPFAATHDIELSYMLEDIYMNYHFEEEVKEHDVEFNYLLMKGRVTTRNAIRLLDMIGYDEKIVKASERAVADFEASGIWKKAGEL